MPPWNGIPGQTLKVVEILSQRKLGKNASFRINLKYVMELRSCGRTFYYLVYLILGKNIQTTHSQQLAFMENLLLGYIKSLAGFSSYLGVFAIENMELFALSLKYPIKGS